MVAAGQHHLGHAQGDAYKKFLTMMMYLCHTTQLGRMTLPTCQLTLSMRCRTMKKALKESTIRFGPTG